MRVEITVALQIKLLIAIPKRRVRVAVLEQVRLTLVMTRCARLKLVTFVIMDPRGHADSTGADETEGHIRACFDAIFNEPEIDALRKVVHLDGFYSQSGKELSVA